MEGSAVGRARRGVRVLLAAFWLLVLLGGAVNPGYSHLNDHVSDLASYGVRAPWIGGLAIATFGVADLVAARVLVQRSRAAGLALLVAGAAGVVIALARIHCSGGAAGCPTSTVPDSTWTDTVHAGAVAVNAFAFSLAMIVCAFGAVGAVRPPWWRLLVAGLAVLSLGLLAQSVGPDVPGAWQRGWLVVNTVLLLLVTAPVPEDQADGSR
jgi:hypothetical protein